MESAARLFTNEAGLLVPTIALKNVFFATYGNLNTKFFTRCCVLHIQFFHGGGNWRNLNCGSGNLLNGKNSKLGLTVVSSDSVSTLAMLWSFIKWPFLLQFLHVTLLAGQLWLLFAVKLFPQKRHGFTSLGVPPLGRLEFDCARLIRSNNFLLWTGKKGSCFNLKFCKEFDPWWDKLPAGATFLSCFLQTWGRLSDFFL